MKRISIKISKGEVVVNSAFMVRESTKIKLITIDCRTKYPEISCVGRDSGGCPNLVLGASKDSLGTDITRKGQMTVVDFIGLKGFSVWSATVYKTNIQVALHREE